MTDDDFFEVNNEIPFKKIRAIRISELTVGENSIEIKVSMDLELGPQGQYVTLVRTDADIAWLLENLSNTEQCPLMPKADCSDMFSQLYQYIGGGQPLRTSKLKSLKQRVLLRCLTMISTILLQHLKQINEEYTMPIFIFFHENFALYHNPIYYKREKVSIQKKVGNFFWEKYALFTGKGQSWENLEAAKKQITQQRGRLFEVTTKLQEYVAQLNKLQEEFISEKQKVKKRATKAEQLCLSYEMQLKYLDLVIEEAKQTAARAEQQRSQCQKLITEYGKLLKNEHEQAVKTNQRLLTEYVRVICANQEKLRIAPF